MPTGSTPRLAGEGAGTSEPGWPNGAIGTRGTLDLVTTEARDGIWTAFASAALEPSDDDEAMPAAALEVNTVAWKVGAAPDSVTVVVTVWEPPEL